jgi:hypothetical protein
MLMLHELLLIFVTLHKNLNLCPVEFLTLCLQNNLENLVVIVSIRKCILLRCTLGEVDFLDFKCLTTEFGFATEF